MFVRTILISTLALSTTASDDDHAGVVSIAYSGTGCPEGSVTSQITPDGSVFSLTFSKFAASTGPGVPKDERRKRCNLQAKMSVPRGYTYSITSVDYRGYASLDRGIVGGRASTYHFSGEPPEPTFAHVISGPVDDTYTFRDSGVAAGSLEAPCGKGKNLRIRSEAKLDVKDNPAGYGLLTADSVDGVVESYRIDWHRCASP